MASTIHDVTGRRSTDEISMLQLEAEKLGVACIRNIDKFEPALIFLRKEQH
jgi:hypothetical protein